jgi:hypothetical protein
MRTAREAVMRGTKILAVAFAALLAGTAACTAEVKDEGEMPEVNVEGGRAPNVDVDPANVNVGTDTNTVVTPEVNVEPAGDGKE